MKKETVPVRNSLLLLLTATIWGIAFVAQSVSMDYIGGFTFNSIRSLIGSLTLLPVILLLSKPKSAEEKNRPQTSSNQKILITGGICCGIILCLASNFSTVWNQIHNCRKSRIYYCLLYYHRSCNRYFSQKKKCSPFIWIAVILSLCGLYLLCLTPGEGFAIGKGELLVLVCAFLFSIHILVIDHFSPLVDGVKMSCIQFFVCGILSGIPALLLEKPDLTDILAAKVPVLYAGIMSCGVAYTLQIIGQKNMNPTVASLILRLGSCISVIAGWLILGQNLNSREIWGCILMFGAIILAQLPQKEASV